MKLLAYYFFFIGCILISSCKKTSIQDCSSLSESDKLWVPYRHHDSIGFVNFLNDSIIYYIASDFKSQTQSGGSEETYPGKYCFEYNSIRLSFLNPSSQSLMDWNKSFTYIVQKENKVTYVYGNGSVKSMNRGINCSNPREYFNFACAIKYDSLKINNEWLKDVYECNFNHNYYDLISKIFLSQQKGIVKIIFQDGQEFELFEHIIFLNEL